MRDLERARDDAKHAKWAAKHQLDKFLLRQGRITGAGNGHVRRILVEAAWAYQLAPRPGREIRLRREAVAPQFKAIAEKAEQRLRRRFRALRARGKPSQKVVTAMARELAGFLWAIAQEQRRLAS